MTARESATPGRFLPVQEAALPHAGIMRAVHFIHEHYSQRLDLEQVASQACLSKYYLSHLFHRVVGVSFQDYVSLFRVDRGKQILTETPYRSLTCIAIQVGFGSLRNFEGQFKRVCGCCPSAYRAKFERRRVILLARRTGSRA